MEAGQPGSKATALSVVEERGCVRTLEHVTALHLRMVVKTAMGQPTEPCHAIHVLVSDVFEFTITITV